MLLQTLVQLNILILATPALAGWIALPMAQPGVVRAACVVLQSRAAEAVAPKQMPAEAVCKTQRVRSVPAVLPRFARAILARPANLVCPFLAAPSVAVGSIHPFPYAIRAP